MNIEARLRRLEKASEGKPQIVVLFGDDELPEGLTANTNIFRFDEARRPETVLPAHTMVVRFDEEARGC